MQRYIKMICAAGLMISSFSCNKDLLDKNNPDAITSKDVWQSPQLINLFVNSIYGDRPGWDYNIYDNITDESRSNWTNNDPQKILFGSWSAEENPMAYWKYPEIRKTNEFFANIDGASLTQEEKTRLKGEVRFMRAFLYFEMVQRYGGVPLITTAQSINEDLLVPRNTMDECFAFVASELDEAVAELPEDAPRGRVGKTAAMALKGRVLLYFASPLYNTANDPERWKKAAEASKAVMNTKKHSLYPDLKNLWLDKSAAHKESIYEVQYKVPDKVHGWDALVKPNYIHTNDAGQRLPLQELVNAFPMKSGKGISEAGTDYDPAHPYSGRDGRFYAFIGYNGAKTKGVKGGALTEITLLIYKGGRDYDSVAADHVSNTYTGYYTFKAVNPENTGYKYRAGCDQPWIELRYAEVLLNFAEAQNEFLATPDADVYAAVNEVRKRAGIQQELVPGSQGKEQMRSLIRNERYVEMCFEKKRYWDLRRWKMAGAMLNGKRYTGVVITKQPDGSFTYDYQPVDPVPVVFSEKMYWMPIPRNEISKNPKLIQNPDWN